MPLETPFPISYWVEPGRLLAGEYPRAWPTTDRAADRQRIHRLLELGVRVFVDLTQEGEQIPYLPMLQERAVALGRPFEHCRMPIADWSVPSPEVVTRILDRIDAALQAGHTVYVHCKAGIGRTGLVVGTYLVRHGLSGEEALARIACLRADLPDKRPSPMLEEQRELVRNWDRRGST